MLFIYIHTRAQSFQLDYMYLYRHYLSGKQITQVTQGRERVSHPFPHSTDGLPRIETLHHRRTLPFPFLPFPSLPFPSSPAFSLLPQPPADRTRGRCRVCRHCKSVWKPPGLRCCCCCCSCCCIYAEFQIWDSRFPLKMGHAGQYIHTDVYARA